MAGDWIKMECSTPDKPEVLSLTVKMKWEDPDLTVGKLFRLWRWFDQQTTDGNARGVTPALLDRQVGVSGFIDALASVGWLVISDDGIQLIDFEKHNGATAKGRAQTAKRVASHRSNATTVTKPATPPLAREEKRREEKNTSAQALPDGVTATVWTDFLRVRKAKKSPMTTTALAGIQAEADRAGLTLNDALQMCCARGWQGFKADWVARSERPAESQFVGAI